jgi:hypothetical protein
MVDMSTKYQADGYVRFWIEHDTEVAMLTASDFRATMSERDELRAENERLRANALMWRKQHDVACETVERNLAENERLRVAKDAVESLICNLCHEPFGLHMWGYHGPGPADGLVCPTPENQARYAALHIDA